MGAAAPFEKTAKQRQAIDLLASPARNVMLYGGSRSGKTFIHIYGIILRALKTKSRHLILRFRFNHAKASIWHETLPKALTLAFPDVKVRWNHSDYFVSFPNGSEIWVGGLDEKNRTEKILGTEWSTIFFNECSQITHDAVETAMTRLAENAGLVNKALFDCNPPNKKHWTYLRFVEHRDPVTKAVLATPDDYAMMLMNPEDNRVNLPAGYIEGVLGRLSQRKRQRFLLGLWLDVAAGALWREEDIKRLDTVPAGERIVIGVDPAASSGEEAEAKHIETGIVVAMKDGDRLIILDDLSGTYTPEEWGTRTIEAYYQWRADRVVGERNNGGDMVEDVIRVRDRNVSFKSVWASQGKSRRAEPIAALYEQGRGYHVGVFPELEDQMCLAEGTRIETNQGPVPIEYIVPGMSVVTRRGMRVVSWAGMTHPAANVFRIVTRQGRHLWTTPHHPVYTSDQGFIPVTALRKGMTLEVLEWPTNLSRFTSMESPLSGRGAGGSLMPRDTTLIETRDCFTVPCGNPLTDLFRVAASSTIRTGIRATTALRTWRRSRGNNMRRFTPGEGWQPLRQRNDQKEREGSGKAGNLIPYHVLRVGDPFSAEDSEPCSAAGHAGADTIASIAVTRRIVPVYNLTVAGEHEFYANGILTHNCSWVQGSTVKEMGFSPDRMDALVWAGTELMLEEGSDAEFVDY